LFFVLRFTYLKMTVVLKLQAVARRSGSCWGSNALRRTTPLRSYSSAASVDGSLPLAGIRVLDMTRVLAGVSFAPECVVSLESKLTSFSLIVLRYWVI
jgi:hypothetical protein